MRKIEIEFPDFDLATLPAIPEGWKDVSWRNDTCPCFMVAGHEDLFVFIDYANAPDREIPETERFTALRMFGSHNEEVISTDDWSELLAKVAA